VSALAGLVSGTRNGDVCSVTVTASTAAQAYLLGLDDAAATSAGGTEWARGLNVGNTAFTCGERAFDVLRGAYSTPSTFDDTSARLPGGGLSGC
jgi:hypothetical protein